VAGEALKTIAVLVMVTGAVAARAAADDTASSPAAPLPWKGTLSLYQIPGAQGYDANLRYKTDSYAAWIGAYKDTSFTQWRIGTEYDFQRHGMVVVPSLQAATHGLVAGSLYSEWGCDWFAIAGASRTNLQPYYNLTFDPNESVQLGAGHVIGAADRLTAYSIMDVRLHTGQQNTHVIWRHHTRSRRLTLDALYKSGRNVAQNHVSALGGTATYDFERWFLRLAYDPYANFSTDTMVRVSTGCRF
jgi:hypothetical protein